MGDDFQEHEQNESYLDGDVASINDQQAMLSRRRSGQEEFIVDRLHGTSP